MQGPAEDNTAISGRAGSPPLSADFGFFCPHGASLSCILTSASPSSGLGACDLRGLQCRAGSSVTGRDKRQTHTQTGKSQAIISAPHMQYKVMRWRVIQEDFLEKEAMVSSET